MSWRICLLSKFSDFQNGDFVLNFRQIKNSNKNFIERDFVLKVNFLFIYFFLPSPSIRFKNRTWPPGAPTFAHHCFTISYLFVTQRSRGFEGRRRTQAAEWPRLAHLWWFQGSAADGAEASKVGQVGRSAHHAQGLALYRLHGGNKCKRATHMMRAFHTVNFGSVRGIHYALCSGVLERMGRRLS